jgi:thioredoxin 1
LDPRRLGSKVIVMRIDSVTDATFAAEVLESDKPVLVDFTAAWCPPCRAMNPILDEIAASRDDLRIVKLDVDDNQSVAAQYSVLSMPTFMLFRNGQPIQTLVGSRPRKRLELELEQALVQEPAGR